MLRPMRVVAAVGAITRLFSLAFLLPILVAMVYDPYDLHLAGLAVPRNVLVFFFAFAITYLVGAGLRRVSQGVSEDDLQEREAFLTVGIGWLVLCTLAMIPFILSGVLVHPEDAFFEAMSGLTTTGATVMAGDLDSVSKSLMMYRALLQYIGGMGIIVLSVAVLSRLTHGGMQMLQAEAPGPSVSRVAPRIAQTARIMWGVYLGLSGVFFLLFSALLIPHGFGFLDIIYESMLHTFTTMSTGGFSNHSESIAFFHDPWIELLVIVFMLAAGTNFTLHYLWMQGDWKALTKDTEWRFFMANFVVITAAIVFALAVTGYGVVAGIRDASFIVASLITSTGFGTADFDAWPTVAKFLLLFVMVTGGTAGSTAGGMKHVRILLLMRLVSREITRIRHPQAVVPVRIAGRIVKPNTIMATVGFFFAFIAIWVIGTVLLVATDPAFSNIADAASASISAVSNMGPGLGVVGPTETYAGLTAASKLILSTEMWFGRLEIFTALIIFLPETWRH